MAKPVRPTVVTDGDPTMTDGKKPGGGIGNRDRSGTNTIVGDWQRYETPLLGIVETVAAIKGVEPTDLPPLANYTDTDALNALLTDSEGVTISFEYADVRITASCGGEVTVEH